MDHVQIAVEMRNGLPLVKLGGRIIGDAVPEFKSVLREQIQADTTLLILDLDGVELLDSTALGVVIACYTTLKKRGGTLVLTHVPQNVQDVLETTRLVSVLEIFPSNDAALQR